MRPAGVDGPSPPGGGAGRVPSPCRRGRRRAPPCDRGGVQECRSAPHRRGVRRVERPRRLPAAAGPGGGGRFGAGHRPVPHAPRARREARARAEAPTVAQGRSEDQFVGGPDPRRSEMASGEHAIGIAQLELGASRRPSPRSAGSWPRGRHWSAIIPRTSAIARPGRNSHHDRPAPMADQPIGCCDPVMG